MTEPFSQSIEILMVDDSKGDVDLIREAFEEARVRNRITAANDGEIALKMLRQEPPFAGVPRPDLILLDLNMPRMSGLELLQIVKADESLKMIPVVVLSSSQAECDIARSYELHANAYMVKPAGFEEFLQAIRSIEGFWLEFVKLPAKPA